MTNDASDEGGLAKPSECARLGKEDYKSTKASQCIWTTLFDYLLCTLPLSSRDPISA